MRRFTIIHQNDIHAHVEAHPELRWHEGKPRVWRAGGSAHIRALVDRIRDESHGACVHVDSGDTIHGTGPAQWTTGAAIVPVLNALGVDLMTPGNWEFGFGPAILRERVTELRFPVVAANVHSADSGEPEFAGTLIRDVGGVRIGFIGLTSPIVALTMPPSFGAGLRFLDALEVLPPLIAELRHAEAVDIVVVVSHYGFAQEVAIARAVDGIDVILGGHTHDVLRAPVFVGRTIISQAGAHGSYVSQLDLEVGTSGVADVQHRLHEVNADAPADAEVARVVERALEPHRGALEEVVGETEVLLHRGTALESPMDHLIADAFRASTGADIAVTHGWRYGVPIPPGPVTAGDLWQMIPTNPALVTVRMTGVEIGHMIERSLDRSFNGDPLRQQGGYVLRFSGMRAVARLNNPRGERLHQIEVGARPLRSTDEYLVAMPGAHFPGTRRDAVPAGVTAIDSVRSFLRSSGSAAMVPGPRLLAV